MCFNVYIIRLADDNKVTQTQKLEDRGRYRECINAHHI